MKLIVLEDGSRSELTLEPGAVTIGRSADNRLRLASHLVSRHHARLECTSEGEFWIEDLASANGTLVNGERVTRRRVAAGDRIAVGSVRLLLEDEPRGARGRESETGPIETDGESDPGLRTLGGVESGEQQRLAAFAQICRRLLDETDLSALLRLIADSATLLSQGERAFVLLGAAEGAAEGAQTISDLTVRVARSFDQADIAVPRSRLSLGIAGQVLASGTSLLSVDAGRDERFSGMASVEDLRLRSVMCLPIRIDGRVEGVLYVDNRLQQGAFTPADLEQAEMLANLAALAIRNARRLTDLRERHRKLELSRQQIERLNEQLGRKVRDRDVELAVVRAELGRERGRYDYTAIVGASDAMRGVFQQLDRIIESELPVLVSGESGTGKELIARAIHFNGARGSKAFVTENCAALPDTLLESELFGHVRGAFTGAHRQKKGLLEQADGGSLFLDEVGDMSTEMQKKLLRFLQEGEFRPVGSDRRVKVDVRLIVASNRDLEALVAQGSFREDLFYRIHVLTLHLPPLRERRDDIPLLAEHLLARAAREAGRPAPFLPHEVVAALVHHEWPGNVRELENEMRRLVVLAQGAVRPEQLSPSVLERRGPRAAAAGEAGEAGQAAPTDIKVAVAELEVRSIEAALAVAGGNKSKAAAELGLSRFALQRKLDKYGFEGLRRPEGEGEGGPSVPAGDGTGAKA